MKEKILLVDDEKDLVDVIKINLEFEGYQVEVAYDGEEALKKLTIVNPDLLILDIMMTKVDGWEVLHQIRT
ncbi:MAG: response regulator, partial [Candidatus Heimdallarchaeota archaeon]|nr:response regulator [Candidatus Heimdallarchaeota archaeon]